MEVKLECLTPHEYLENFRGLIPRIFESIHTGCDLTDIKEEFRKLQLNSFSSGFQLGKAYDALTERLLEKGDGSIDANLSFEIKQLPSGAVFPDADLHHASLCFPNPLLSAEIGILWAFLGKEKNVYQLARFQRRFFDHTGSIFSATFMNESDHDREKLIAYNAFFFHLSYLISQDIEMKEIAEQLKSSIDFPIPKFIRYLAENKPKFKKVEMSDISPFIKDKDFGFATYSGNEFSCIATLGGASSGIGAFHKKEAKIITMGPSYASMGDLSHFGVYRTPKEKTNSFKDVHVKKSKESFSFSGWTRPQSSEDQYSFSPSWMHVDFQADQNTLNLAINFLNREENKPLKFFMFIDCDELTINDDVKLYRNSLDHFQGPAGKIICNENSLAILPEFKGNMDIIPLVGKSFFWDASFIVAFDIDNNDVLYRWQFN